MHSEYHLHSNAHKKSICVRSTHRALTNIATRRIRIQPHPHSNAKCMILHMSGVVPATPAPLPQPACTTGYYASPHAIARFITNTCCGAPRLRGCAGVRFPRRACFLPRGSGGAGGKRQRGKGLGADCRQYRDSLKGRQAELMYVYMSCILPCIYYLPAPSLSYPYCIFAVYMLCVCSVLTVYFLCI